MTSYRKLNDRSLSSSNYQKKDDTEVRAILKQETRRPMDDDRDESYADRVHDTAACYIAEGMSEEEAYERAL